MAVTRQDAWTADDDLLLAEITLRHIREGSTQLAAFEEVGEKLGRTAAACGFRWNSVVRKKYETAIQIAKAQRQKKKQGERRKNPLLHAGEGTVAPAGSSLEEEISYEAIIRFLRGQKSSLQDLHKRVKQLEKELSEKEQEIAALKEENEKMKKELATVQNDYQVMNEDYKALIQIMDRARKMAVLVEEEEGEKTKFKMDLNGNLERIDK
ncbi:RsfA family transcriptional regulator [Bacillaceae bacterium]